MAKAVYRPMELEVVADNIILSPPEAFELAHLVKAEEEPVEISEEDLYTGPTAEELRQEAEAFKVKWNVEREAMDQSAKIEADRIINNANDAADDLIRQKTDEAAGIKTDAEETAERIIADAQEKAKRIEAESAALIEARLKEAEDQGTKAGREAGFAQGMAEVERLVDRTRVVLERAQDKRGEILVDTEQEIIDLVLLMARKVVKVISENQRTVVVSNIVQALRKIKSRGNIIIRVNLADLKLSTEHLNNFIKMVEGSKSVQIAEDSSVDPGGCIIETDFGEIDARIASQLAELEAKILEVSPITSRPKPAAKTEGA